MWLPSADMVLAAANSGLALIFYPLMIRDQIKGYCHIPLFTSVPKVGLLVLLTCGFLMAGLHLAALTCGADLFCWVLLVIQRVVLGNVEPGAQVRS